VFGSFSISLASQRSLGASRLRSVYICILEQYKSYYVVVGSVLVEIVQNALSRHLG